MMRAVAGLADRSVEAQLAVLAARGEPAAGGVAAALACASASALVELTAGLAADRLADGRRARDARLGERMRELGARATKLRQRLPAVADADVEAYERVLLAEDAEGRAVALEQAAGPPLEVAELAAEVAEAAAAVAAAGEWPFTADAVVAARLAAAAAAGAAELVAVDLGDRDDRRVSRARHAAERAARAAA